MSRVVLESPHICLFVCFGSVTAFVPWGQLPREDLRRAPLPPRPLVTPGLVALHVPYPPILIVMHSASGQSPPPSSCPIQISYQVSGLPPPCLPVLHIYLKNPHICPLKKPTYKLCYLLISTALSKLYLSTDHLPAYFLHANPFPHLSLTYVAPFLLPT